jgi:phosphomannomutase
MLAVLGKNLGEVASDMPRNTQVRRDVHCPTEELGRVMRQAMDYSRDMRKILIDGIKFYPHKGSDSWVLIIPEKDRPYCTVLADARDAKEAHALADEYAALVEEWRKTGE